MNQNLLVSNSEVVLLRVHLVPVKLHRILMEMTRCSRHIYITSYVSSALEHLLRIVMKQ
jgi:hypothetical protein